MNTFSFKNIFYASLIALTFSGCALEPHIEVDTRAAGQSEVGKVIASGAFLDTKRLENRITELLRLHHVFDNDESVDRLQGLGFTCAQLRECVYVGNIRSKLVMTDGSILPGNDQTNRFTVVVHLGEVAERVEVSRTTVFNNGRHENQRL